MTITVSGLGSGLNYDDWIKKLVAVKQADIDKVNSQVSTFQKKENALTTIKNNYTSLLTNIQAFTQATSANNVFHQKTATSSSEAITAKVDYTADAQSVSVSVDTLATATKAQSVSAVASYVDRDTKISDISEGALKTGSFSVYVDGTKHNLTIGANDTLGTVLDNLNGIEGVSASINNGKLTITKSGTSTVTVGSSSDTSNFSKVMSLVRDEDTGAYTSSKAIFDTNTSAVLTTTQFDKGTVKQGTFTIGSANFTIGATTTLDSLIKQINNNADAGVTAYWDSNSGKLALTATEEGATNINIQAGTSNFTDIMGLTTSTWNPDGSMATTQLATDSQDLGTNAVLTINGTQITSSSNTVTSDISGIKGLTLTLNEETDSTATVAIATDKTAAATAITDFVNAFNTVVSNTDKATASNGLLYGQSILNMLNTNIRKTATAAVQGEDGYNSLASIGITTGKVSSDVNADVSKLVIDTDKLNAALEDNPEAVMKLLAGNGTTAGAGVLNKLEKLATDATNPTKGYFVSQEKSFEKQVTNLNDKIDTMTTNMQKYQAQLEAKFAAMDKLISSLQNSASIFDSYFNNKNKNSDSSTL